MDDNFLCLNSARTKVMLLGSPHQLCNAGSLALSFDGVIFDASLSFEPFMQNAVSFISEILHVYDLCCHSRFLKG